MIIKEWKYRANIHKKNPQKEVQAHHYRKVSNHKGREKKRKKEKT